MRISSCWQLNETKLMVVFITGNETIEKNDKCDIRRIFLEDEAKEIIHLQSDAPEFNEHYPRHSQWLEKAVKEIVNGSRIAFGAFGTESHNIEPRVELVGSIILKFDHYTNIARMKNLFIRKNSRRIKNGTYLCEVVENYCAKQGYSKIETEVPVNEYGTIQFLLERGYKIREIKESPYKDKDQIYEIYKILTPLYGEDFYDLFNMAKWLLKVIYNFKNIKSNYETNTMTFDLNLMVDSSDLDLGVESLYMVEGIAPNGLVVVLDKDNIKFDEIAEQISKEKIKHNLVFVFGRTFETDIIGKCNLTLSY